MLSKRIWKDWLISLLGGYDRIDTYHLVYRAGLLASSVKLPRTRGTADLVAFERECVMKAIQRVDPLYAYVRCYDEHIERSRRERTVVTVEGSVRTGEGKVDPSVDPHIAEARIRGVLDKAEGAQA